jgi:hypothetical protein
MRWRCPPLIRDPLATAGPIAQLVDHQRLFDDLAGAHSRVER